TYAARLILSATSTNTTLVPNTNIVFQGSDSNRWVVITPATNQFGLTRITITVSDGTNSVNTGFNVTVNSVNDAPTLNPLPNLGLTFNPSSPTVNLTGISAGGGESQTLAVRVSSSNTALLPTPTVTYTTPSSTGSVLVNPDNQTSGSSVVTVTVWDNGSPSNSFSQSFTVFVRDSANSASPTLTGLTNRSTLEDTPISIPFVV